MYSFVLCLLAAVQAASASATQTCKTLDAKLPGRVSYPDSTAYNASISSYYSGQERDLNPGCIFRPTSTAEVSQFIKLVTSSGNTQFAVRGGGHTLWPGAANVKGGITVDMRAMNNLTLSKDHKIAHLGAGAVFSDIYPQLVPYNLTVMGGRVPGIGAGGFVTGGGITFLSRRNGFSCDNVYGYEVVLASGKVVYATQSSNSDLWLALKGGSNNFGIITRFDLAAFPMGNMWYSDLSYNYTDSILSANAKAFSNFMKPANYDSAAMMGQFVYYTNQGFGVSNAMWYIEDVASPKVYDAFTKIPNLGGVSELATVDQVVNNFGENLPVTTGRSYQLTFTFNNPPAAVYLQLIKIWEKRITALSKVEGLFIEFLFQPQPVTNGTNMFGLTPGKTDYVLIDMTAAYDNASDDALVESVINDIVKQQRALLKSSKYLVDFIYLNYADISQNVLSTWGASNLAKLQAVSKKYDPKGVFQTRSPGGYKLFKK
ncbi:FAD-binding domain-containing protein [Trichoderma citrinoviride]|uniref:FAD-binding domain-containing protein n=1 Tax=Trichoderma citrinoviride TaxID=58853 RepID=A0A2T4B6J6_9HYPO|nr:FAD-binding domain-containing protein [Trichoderma citrinoviride]PTB64859.1 FAD-binding domain-containing protein [Trichoderma citrinoviride]